MIVIDTYTLTIQREAGAWLYTETIDIPAALAEMEENLTLLLPSGWRAVIRRWDEGDQDDD